jgi:hypothetical protein
MMVPDDAPGRGLGQQAEVLHNWAMGGPWRYDDENRHFAPLDVDLSVLRQAMSSVGAGISAAGCTSTNAGKLALCGSGRAT